MSISLSFCFSCDRPSFKLEPSSFLFLQAQCSYGTLKHRKFQCLTLYMGDESKTGGLTRGALKALAKLQERKKKLIDCEAESAIHLFDGHVLGHPQTSYTKDQAPNCPLCHKCGNAMHIKGHKRLDHKKCTCSLSLLHYNYYTN